MRDPMMNFGLWVTRRPAISFQQVRMQRRGERMSILESDRVDALWAHDLSETRPPLLRDVRVFRRNLRAVAFCELCSFWVPRYKWFQAAIILTPKALAEGSPNTAMLDCACLPDVVFPRYLVWGGTPPFRNFPRLASSNGCVLLSMLVETL